MGGVTGGPLFASGLESDAAYLPVPNGRPSSRAGIAPRYPLHQRIALMQLVRTLLADPLLVYNLFAAYDLAVERKLDAVQARNSLTYLSGSAFGT